MIFNVLGGGVMAKRVFRKIGIALGILAGLLAVFLAVCCLNHRIQLAREDSLLVPPGQMVEVNGHRMHVYAEGSGEQTLVFLSGAGTCSPMLDFRSLYALLRDTYTVVVVEKAGYGFSEDSDAPRDVDTVLSETRQALTQAGFRAPYVLCPHSMSGIEALYWAQQYPQEVSAIIGLDMAVPASYENMKINMPLLRLAAFAARTGVTRCLPELARSDAVKYGSLTESEKELYKLLFYRRTATNAMLNEAQTILSSARMVAAGCTVDVPMLLFASNGSGGTGYDEAIWRGFQYDFAASVPNATVIALDCPHYVHDYKYEQIAAEIRRQISP